MTTLPGVERARALLQRRFEDGRQATAHALKDVQRYVPSDYLIESQKQLLFFVEKGHIQIGWKDDQGNLKAFPIHRHALAQLAEKTGMKMQKPYVDMLLENDPEWLADSLQRHYRRQEKKEYLARVANGQLLGWLTDSFWLADTATLLEAFIETCTKFEAVPIECRHLETRFMMKMVIPEVFEPIPNELLVFGVQFRTSDVGDGAYELALFFERLACRNGMLTDDVYRRVHLGAKLTRESFSVDTLKKEAALIAAITRDTVASFLSKEKINEKLEIIRAADEREISLEYTLEALRKNSRLSKVEIARIKELAVIDNPDVLPPVRKVMSEGHTSANRLANMLAYLAGEMKDKDAAGGIRAMEIEKIAGEVLGFKKTKKTDQEAEE